MEVLLTAAHHGASFVIDAIDPVGTLDRRVYERLGRVFEQEMVYEPYFRGELAADVGVYYPSTGRYNTQEQKYNVKPCCVTLTTTLIENNIPVAVLSSRERALQKYRMILAPAVAGMPDGQADALAQYVENGGTLYFSGVEEPSLLERFFGAKVERFTDESAVYLAPTAAGAPLFWEFTEKYPLPCEFRLPVISLPENSPAEIFATLTLPYTKPDESRFASIHSNPPGIPTDIPAIVSASYGKGTVLWSAAPLEIDTRYAQKTVLMNLLRRFMHAGTLSVLSDAPRQVELVTFREDKEVLLSAVDLLCTEEQLPVRDFRIRVRCDRKPVSAVRLASLQKPEQPLDFTWEDGYASFDVRGLVMFDMFRLTF